MTNTQAILIGASLIAASVLLTNGIHPAEAQHYSGSFQLEHHSNTLANAGVFRLDTSTGEVSYCYIADPSGASLVCSKAVK